MSWTLELVFIVLHHSCIWWAVYFMVNQFFGRKGWDQQRFQIIKILLTRKWQILYTFLVIYLIITHSPGPRIEADFLLPSFHCLSDTCRRD